MKRAKSHGAGRRRKRPGDGAGVFDPAFARLSGHVSEAARTFRELTGFTAVTSLGSPPSEPGARWTIAPPVHPVCAKLLRKRAGDAPCEEEWRKHLKGGQRSRGVQRHICPLSLRCSCVPIYSEDVLVGVAKLVANPRTAARRFSQAVLLLELAMAKACQDCRVSVLSEQLEMLRERMGQILEITGRAGAVATAPDLKGPGDASRSEETNAGRLVDRALQHISGHYLEHGLSLRSISSSLGTNDKYLSHLFTSAVGQHMRAYILQLRIQHACRLMLTTDKPIKAVAYESGFKRTDDFRRTFCRYVGVPPGVYRGAFIPA